MKKIVVTGANGTIGSRVVEILGERKADVAALVRDPSKARFSKDVQVVQGSFDDPASLRTAFAGADIVVSITPASAHGVEHANAVLEAARAANVRKIVRVSALKADPSGPTDNTRQHGKAEAALRASGLTYVILRPHLFMQNVLGMLGTVTRDGKLYFGSGAGRMGMIDTRDVADAICAVVATDKYDGSVLELTGPKSIDYHAVAAALGKGLGRQVDFVPVPPEAAAEGARGFGADDWTVAVIRDYCTAYASGFGDFTTNEVEKLTGHAPRSIDDFVRDVVPTAGAR